MVFKRKDTQRRRKEPQRRIEMNILCGTQRLLSDPLRLRNHLLSKVAHDHSKGYYSQNNNPRKRLAEIECPAHPLVSLRDYSPQIITIKIEETPLIIVRVVDVSIL